MAAATIINTSYGYKVGGTGTDATTATTDIIKIKGIVCVAAASADTILVTAVGGTSQTLLNWVAPISLSDSFNFYGARVNGVVVTLSSTANHCLIITE